MYATKRLLICLVLILVAAVVKAQETRVAMQVNNPQHEPIPFATISILSLPDSANRMVKATDSLGQAFFMLLRDHAYLIRITSVNYLPFEKSIVVKRDDTLFTFTAAQESATMSGVVVRSTRPLMRQEDDKTIVDPEQLAAASTNAYEILEKTPGLFVDQDGNIYLSSTTPAMIYINGREQKMSTSDIATMLKNLPPNAIASIEILRTPSARYDASGGGGIVNVVLKKGVRIGLTGSMTIGGNQGKYGNQFAGLNMNNNNGKLTTYINLQYGRRNNEDHIQTNRIFVADSVLGQDARTQYRSSNGYVGFGLSYQAGKKWELGYDGRLSFGHSDNNSHNFSQIYGVHSMVVSGSNTTDVHTRGNNLYLSQGANARYRIDTLGSEWTTDISWSMSPNETDQDFGRGEGALDNRLQFYSFQTNLVKKLKGKITVETGLKSSNVRFRNHSDYSIFYNGGSIHDDQRSGSYRYAEGIHSAYLQASKNLSGFIIKAGTRMENTNMSGLQLLPSDTSFSLHRTDFFPYVYLSKNIMKIAGYELRAYLVYRRTISRPGYEYLNPSVRIVDPYLYETGNPRLRPQFTKNYEANISVDERPLVAIGFNETRDIFTQVVYASDTNSKVSSRTYDNLGSNKETYIRLLGAIPPGGKYFFVVGAQYNHNFYQGIYENQPLSFKRGTWTIFTFHQLKLTPLTQVMLHGFARFNGQQQFYELSSFGELRFSVNQQLLKKKLNLTLSLNDIFRTNHNEFTIDQGSVHAFGIREGDTRRFGFNLRYNFGIRKKEENNPFNIEAPAN